MYPSSTSSSSQGSMGHGGSGSGVGLTRYVSAPSSVLSPAVDSVISGGTRDFSVPASSHHSPLGPSRYFSESAGKQANNSKEQPDNKSPAAAATSTIQRSFNFHELGIGSGVCGGASTSTSPLVRHSSSPARFLNQLATAAGLDDDRKKKRKIDDVESSSLPMIPHPAYNDTAMSAAAAADEDELWPIRFERLAVAINPAYEKRLIAEGELGYQRPITQLELEPRFYTVNVANFRDAISRVLLDYMKSKLLEQGSLAPNRIDMMLMRLVPRCADACMTALYARLRTIHRFYGRYSGRFTTPGCYTKETELPLPFADAIQQFGVFEVKCVETHYLMVPVYPEGTRNEGRASEAWYGYQYESYIPWLKQAGIPMKSVDTRSRVGSPWWTYKHEKVGETYRLKAIIPFTHYSDHSAILASMFITPPAIGEEQPRQIIDPRDDDEDYGFRLRHVIDGIQVRSFAALCHAPPRRLERRS